MIKWIYFILNRKNEKLWRWKPAGSGARIQRSVYRIPRGPHTNRILRSGLEQRKVRAVRVRDKEPLLVPDVHRRLANLGHRRRVRRKGRLVLAVDAQEVRAWLQSRPHRGRELDEREQGQATARHVHKVLVRRHVEVVRYQVRGPLREVPRSRLLPAQGSIFLLFFPHLNIIIIIIEF